MRKEKSLVSSTKYKLDRYEGDYAIFLMANDEEGGLNKEIRGRPQ